jgi:hypothetical protein
MANDQFPQSNAANSSQMKRFVDEMYIYIISSSRTDRHHELWPFSKVNLCDEHVHDSRMSVVPHARNSFSARKVDVL